LSLKVQDETPEERYARLTATHVEKFFGDEYSKTARDRDHNNSPQPSTELDVVRGGDAAKVLPETKPSRRPNPEVEQHPPPPPPIYDTKPESQVAPSASVLDVASLTLRTSMPVVLRPPPPPTVEPKPQGKITYITVTFIY
jgi:hypothetical protein